MKPKKKTQIQGDLLRPWLLEQLNPENNLFILSQLIDWEYLEQEFDGLFSEKWWAPAKPVRLVVGLLMLEHMYRLSDEEVVHHWVENPYWQFFCGYQILQWDFPINPSSLSKWRKRLGSEGMEKILAVTIKSAVETGAVKKSSLKNVIVDTTVMPKNITYPTDAKLYYRGLQTLLRMANKRHIKLRQSFKFLAKEAIWKAGRYAHARQMKRAKKERKKLKTYLGRLKRDIERKISGDAVLQKYFENILCIIDRVLTQTKNSKNKVYSIHEPHTECISKGKAHKKYEFGCKASLVTTHKEGLVLDAQALHGNPYDGHTLQQVLTTSEKRTGTKIDKAYVDKGYKGHKIESKKIYISGQKKGVTKWIKRQMKRRQSIEPHIGHMKSDGKLDRNFLRGVLGDKLNAILCGIGHNLRLIIRKLFPKVKLQPT